MENKEEKRKKVQNVRTKQHRVGRPLLEAPMLRDDTGKELSECGFPSECLLFGIVVSYDE